MDEQAIENIPVGIICFNDSGTITYANSFISKILGYEPALLTGKHIEETFAIAGRIFYQTHFFPLLKMHGQVREVFFTLLTKTGGKVSVVCNADTKDRKGNTEYTCVFFEVKEREKYEQRLLAAKKEAEEALQKNEALINVTSALENQALELDRQLARAQQNTKDISQFSKFISHDLQEPIRKIAVLAEKVILQQADHLSKTAVSDLDKIHAACTKLRSLAFNLERFISLNVIDHSFELVELEKICMEAFEYIKIESGSDLLLVKEPLPAIYGDGPQLNILFRNLIRYLSGETEISKRPEIIINSTIVQQNSFRVIKSRYRYVDFARISFSTRYSVPAHEYQDLFVLKKTNDLSEMETNFNLTFCKKIAENHNGSIRCDFSSHYGRCIVVMLPLLQDPG